MPQGSSGGGVIRASSPSKAVGTSLIDWIEKAELLLHVGIRLPSQSLLLHVCIA